MSTDLLPLDSPVAPAAVVADFEPLHRRIERRAHLSSAAVALAGSDGDWTWRRLNEAANRLAWHLRELGAAPGRLVAVCLPRGADAIVAFLAALKTGAGFVPLDPAYPHARRAHKLADARPVAVVTRRDAFDGMSPQAAALVVLDDPDLQTRVAAQRTDDLPVTVGPLDPAYVIYTSGSTGTPKGVVVPQRALARHAAAVVMRFRLTEHDRVLQFASLAFDICIEEIFPTLAAGGTVVLRREADAGSVPGFLATVAGHRVSVLNLPTAFWHELVLANDAWGAPFPPSVRLVVVGGEKASRALYRRWVQAVGDRPRWMNAYGPTETTVTATVYEPAAWSDDATLDELPIGTALNHVTCHVLDEHLRPVPDGEEGELCIGGDGVALGYLNLPERTTARFVPDPFAGRPGARLYRTGDRARVIDGGRLAFLGRVDHQMKIRGYRIEAVEIESALEAHPDVAQAIVVADAADHDGGHAVLRACLRLREGVRLDEASLRRHLGDRLPAYMVPARYAVHDRFPMLPNGKVDRTALESHPPAAVAAALPAPAARPPADDPPGSQGDLVSWLSPVFAEVLGLPAVDPDAGFFDLGGHSLLAIRLLSRLSRDRPDLPLSLELLFAHPSVHALAAALDARGVQVTRSVVRLNRRQPAIESRTPAYCLCGVALYAELARAMGDDRPVHGVFLPVEVEAAEGRASLDLASMAAAYAELVDAHTGGGPCILAGASFGGTLAFEVARQLTGRGRTVELLVLLDAVLLRSYGPLALVERLLRHRARRRGVVDAAGDLQALEERRLQALDRAEEAYEARLPRHDGPTLVVEASGVAAPGVPSRRRPDLGWRGRFVRSGLGWTDVLPPGRTGVVTVPGDHLGILGAPGVHAIAQAVRDALARPR